MKAVREMDHDGLLLCRIQAETFELSVEKAGTSSEIFIRRFMKSEAAQLLDSGAILYRMYEPQDLPDDIEEQYGASTYGSVKFSRDEMHWIRDMQSSGSWRRSIIRWMMKEKCVASWKS